MCYQKGRIGWKDSPEKICFVCRKHGRAEKQKKILAAAAIEKKEVKDENSAINFVG